MEQFIQNVRRRRRWRYFSR